VLVSELIDALSGYAGINRGTLVTHHPLQPFDTRYFVADKNASSDKQNLFSYATDWVQAARNYQQPLPLKKPFDFSRSDFSKGEISASDAAVSQATTQRHIELDDLLDWAAHPSRHLLRRMGVELARQQDQLLDEEHFDADGLTQYQLAHDGADAAAERGVAFDALLRQWTYAGLLPVGAVGRAVAENLQHSLTPFVQSAAKAGHFDARQTIDIVVDRFRIAGVVDRLGDGERFDARFSALKGRNLLPAWLRHLLLNAAGHVCATRLLLRDADIRLAPVPLALSQQALKSLLELYRRSVDLLQPVFVDLSYRLVERQQKGDDHFKLQAEIEKFYTEDENSRGLFTDEYDSYLFGARQADAIDIHIAIAQQLFGGIFDYLRRSEVAMPSGEVAS